MKPSRFIIFAGVGDEPAMGWKSYTDDMHAADFDNLGDAIAHRDALNAKGQWAHILDSMCGFVVWPGYTQPERLHATGPLGNMSEIRHGVRFSDTVLTRCSSDVCADSSVLDVGRLYKIDQKPCLKLLARSVHT